MSVKREPMPWGWIARKTGAMTVMTFAGLSAFCLWALHVDVKQKEAEEERNRYRWTDKNRWE